MIDSKTEMGVLPDNKDIALVHQLFRMPEANIHNPSIAPPVLFLDKFWSVFPKKITFTRQQEIFLGFDQKSPGLIQCTEICYGEEGGVKHDKSHLLSFHTEPYQYKKELTVRTLPLIEKPYSDTEVIAHNFPKPYLPDLRDLLENPSGYTEVAFKFGATDNDPFAAIVVLKTQQWKSMKAKMFLWELMHEMSYTPKRPFKYAFAEDKFVTEKLGLAVYRGFVSMPPTATEPLRLRRYS